MIELVVGGVGLTSVIVGFMGIITAIKYSDYGFMFILSIVMLALGTVFIVFVIQVIRDSDQMKKFLDAKAEENKNKVESFKAEYEQELKKINPPINTVLIELLSGINLHGEILHIWKYMIWTDNNYLYLFPEMPKYWKATAMPKIKITKIEKENILQYSMDGELYRETKISGGGGGGSSVKGAIIGGVLAGEAGAIIGSRKNNKEIKSEVIEHDMRKTILTVFDNREKNLELSHKSYTSLKKVIPEKDIVTIEAIKMNEEINTSKIGNYKEEEILVQARMLKQMLEESIINEDQYNEKIDKLLS